MAFLKTFFVFQKGVLKQDFSHLFQIISQELYRNLGLAILCISITTLILLWNWLGCLLVVLCVLLTLTNVAGFMHFWGMYIISTMVL